MNIALKTTEAKAILDVGTGSITGDGGSVKGAIATVDHAGAIDKRVTAMPKLFDSRGQRTMAPPSLSKWTVVGPTGTTHSLVIEVVKTR